MRQSEALKIVEDLVSKCTKCAELTSYREENEYKTVFGTGNINADIMILGEAPGENEAVNGEPFIGKAGVLLTNILQNIGLSRDSVYICNVIKCRPPRNRNPLPDEVVNCSNFLEAQIKVVNPKYIICFGAVAAQNLLKTETTITSLRGHLHQFKDKKVLCTYHPSYLLRNPKAKELVSQDLQILVKEINSN